MKKKLFLLLCTLLTMIGVQNVKADVDKTDVTDTYITNPSFENDAAESVVTGWTAYGHSEEGLVDASSFPVTSTEDFVNKDGNKICKFHGDRWTGWWSYWIVYQKVTLPTGIYELDATIETDEGKTVSLFAMPDAALDNVGNYKYKTDVTGINGSTGTVTSVTFTSDGSTPVVLGAGLVNVTSYYPLTFKADHFKLYSLKNVDFSDRMSNSTSNWTGVGEQTKTAVCKTDGVETYQGNSKQFSVGDVLYQTITDLPNGNYEISFYAWENYANWASASIAYGDGYAQAFANGSIHNLTSIENKDGRAWDNDNLYTLQVYVKDGTLKYGVKNVRAGGNWVACKPKSLTYLGADISEGTNLLSNSNFEDAYAAMSNSGRSNDRDFFIPQGWTVTYTDGNGWACSALNSGDKSWNNFEGKAQPADGGSNVYWTRMRDANTALTLSQKVAVPAGYYILKGEGYNENSGNGSATLSAKIGEDTYSINYVDGSWNYRQVYFNLDEAKEVEIKYSVNSTSGVVIAGIDNITLFRPSAGDLKPSLQTEISTATDARKSANEGTGVFQIPAAAGTTFAGAISAAQAVYDNGSATADEVYTAIDDLKDAEEAYANTTLNAPEVGKRYCIVVATEGHPKNGLAVGIALGATSANNPTGYTINTNNTTNQSVAFTQVSGNSYNINFETAEGTTYLTYGTENGSAAGWKDSQIQATTVTLNKGDFTIAATNKANVFNIYNIHTNSTIACQTGGNIYTEAGNADFTLVEATAANLKVSEGKLGTFIAPFDITLPDNVKAYSATSSETKVTLKKEYDGGETLPAGTPVIIYGDGVSVNETFYGVPTVDDNQTEGALVGILNESEMTVPKDAYVLQTQTDVQAFYKLAAAAPGALNRCYVVAGESEARLIISFDEEDPTGINAIEVAEVEVEGLKDGKYLIGGKIVMVKNNVKYNANGQILK